MDKKTPVAMLAVLYASAFLAGFNENLVNMALMSIMTEFTIDSVLAQWLVTGYMIVATVVVMSMAFLYQRFSLKKLYFSGATFSIIGSALGLFSPTFETLMVARLIQALGTGIYIPLMMNTILVVTPKNKLGQYISIGGCMITFGPAFAPIVCGGVVTIFGWRSIFFLPTLIMVILTVLAFFKLKNLTTKKCCLDFISVVIASLILFTLSYGLSEILINFFFGIISLVLCVVFSILFVLRQFRVEFPLINLSPMKSNRFWPSILLNTLAMMGTFSCSVLLPIYFEGACGLSPFVAGMILLIPVLCNCGATLFAGRIFDKFGEWPLLPVGFSVVACGFLLLFFTSSTLNLVLVFIAAVAVYAGTGLIFSPSQTAGLKTLSVEENPHGVALSTTFVQIAACIGPSLYTGLMSFGQTTSQYASSNSSLALADGFSIAMLVAFALGVLAVFVALAYSLSAHRRQLAPSEKVQSKNQKLIVKDLMKDDPWTVDENSSVKQAMQLMIEKHIGGIPVVSNKGEVKGFISDGDIVRYVAEQTCAVSSPYALIEMAKTQTFDEKVQELLQLDTLTIATDQVVSLGAEDDVESALKLLSEHKLKKIPVLENGRIVGTLNRSDILHFIMSKSLGI